MRINRSVLLKIAKNIIIKKWQIKVCGSYRKKHESTCALEEKMTESNHYKIHPIVMGTKAFDKGMMTYQYDYGKPYTIPIYCWYLEGGDKKILVDTGEMAPMKSREREEAIGGKIYTFEEGLSRGGYRCRNPYPFA
jgi:hypothetical protein